jgi:hypothetical protein
LKDNELEPATTLKSILGLGPQGAKCERRRGASFNGFCAGLTLDVAGRA